MKADEISIEEIKARLDIPTVWRLLSLPGEPNKSCTSPFRQDRHPSFSVFDGGRRFRDHASGEAGMVIDFICLALDAALPEALAWAREKCGGPLPVTARPAPALKPEARAGKAPALRMGKPGELEALARLRGFSVVMLRGADGCGLLRFADVWGRAAWCVCDPGGRIVEARRLDGQPWAAYGSMPARKCHAWGGGKNWPVNLEAAAQCPKLLFCEGGPDVLAALEIIRREGVAETVGAVGMLGAANTRLDAAALPFFRGKVIRLFPHADEAGRRAAREWARVLRAAGAARADAFDLAGLACVDGTPGKDLCDALNIGAECVENHTKFQGKLTP